MVLVDGFNPSEKYYMVKIGSFRQVGDENTKKCLIVATGWLIGILIFMVYQKSLYNWVGCHPLPFTPEKATIQVDRQDTPEARR